jgi:hypothetical protein
MINKNDNDNLTSKINLRLEVLKLVENPNILDCFHGNGILWKLIENKLNKKLTITGIEKIKDKGDSDFYGDCMKFLPNLDLSVYNIIDLDSYGVKSLEILDILINKKYKGYIILTVIVSGYGSVGKFILTKIGYTPNDLKKANILISRDFENNVKKYLYSLDINEIKGYFYNRKNYFYIKLN